MLLPPAMDGVAATEDDTVRFEEVHHRERGFAAVAARRRDGDDQITEGEVGTADGFQGLVHTSEEDRLPCQLPVPL